MNSTGVLVFTDERLAEYNFGETHPFGPSRFYAFLERFVRMDFAEAVQKGASREALPEELEWFHTHDYVEFVRRASERGDVYLDDGDTPSYVGVFEAAGRVVGTTLSGIEKILNKECRRAFSPIAGMHHGRRDRAGGFCVFNDCGVAIEMLRRKFGVRRVAYVDIDAHHGDGVYYSFESDPDLTIVDFHEDGRFLYPGTGHRHETGKGPAAGTKLNIPMSIGADDGDFLEAWSRAEEFLDRSEPEFILFQCGVDSLEGDPLTHLCYTEKIHAHVAERLCLLADRHCSGRLLAMGGGGYNLENIATGLNAVIGAMVRN